jgi:SET domain-containing protein
VQEDNLFYYFTNKKIKKGEELFLDYNDFNWSGKRNFV